MTKRADGRYQEVLTIDGKKKYFYGKTKQEALQKINLFIQEENLGPRFKSVVAEWEQEHEAETTYNGHRALRQPIRSAVDAFGDQRIRDITARQIDVYIRRIASQGYAKRTVKSYLSVLSLVFNYAVRLGYVSYNPASSISIPPRLKENHRDLPPPEDIERVKNSVGCHFGMFALFLMYTGLRRGEALAIRYDDIDFSGKTISVNKSLYWDGNHPHIKTTKTKAGTRTVILPDVLASVLPHDGTGYVFGGDKPMTNTAFRYAWNRYVKESGLKSTCHQLRHLYATILYEAGIDEKVAQELMGHSSITITRDVYTHIRTSRLADATDKLNTALNGNVSK